MRLSTKLENSLIITPIVMGQNKIFMEKYQVTVCDGL